MDSDQTIHTKDEKDKMDEMCNDCEDCVNCGRKLKESEALWKAKEERADVMAEKLIQEETKLLNNNKKKKKKKAKQAQTLSKTAPTSAELTTTIVTITKTKVNDEKQDQFDKTEKSSDSSHGTESIYNIVRGPKIDFSKLKIKNNSLMGCLQCINYVQQVKPKKIINWRDSPYFLSPDLAIWQFVPSNVAERQTMSSQTPAQGVEQWQNLFDALINEKDEVARRAFRMEDWGDTMCKQRDILLKKVEKLELQIFRLKDQVAQQDIIYNKIQKKLQASDKNVELCSTRAEKATQLWEKTKGELENANKHIAARAEENYLLERKCVELVTEQKRQTLESVVDQRRAERAEAAECLLQSKMDELQTNQDKIISALAQEQVLRQKAETQHNRTLIVFKKFQENLQNRFSVTVNELVTTSVADLEAAENVLLTTLKTVTNTIIHKRLQEEHKEESLCVFCLDNPSSHALIPCGHRIICQVCVTSAAPKTCPTCRRPVLDLLHVFV
jgi:hypothetical protein